MWRDSLTPREQELVELLCTGLSNIDIAKEMGIQKQTVAASLQNIYKKLDVNSRSKLIVKYMTLKIKESQR